MQNFRIAYSRHTEWEYGNFVDNLNIKYEKKRPIFGSISRGKNEYLGKQS